MKTLDTVSIPVNNFVFAEDWLPFLKALVEMGNAFLLLVDALAEIDAKPKNVDLRILAEKALQGDYYLRSLHREACKRGWGYRPKLNSPNPNPKPKPYWLRIRSRLW